MKTFKPTHKIKATNEKVKLTGYYAPLGQTYYARMDGEEIILSDDEVEKVTEK